MPPAAASVEARAKVAIRVRSRGIPTRRAASALPPMARMWRPKRVLVTSRSTAATIPTERMTASGRPRSAPNTAAAPKTAAAVAASARPTLAGDRQGSPAATRRRRRCTTNPIRAATTTTARAQATAGA